MWLLYMGRPCHYIKSNERDIPFLDACGVSVECNGVNSVGQFSTLCVNLQSSVLVCEVSVELAMTALEDTVSVCGVGGGVGEIRECIWRIRVHSVRVCDVKVCGKRVCGVRGVI